MEKKINVAELLKDCPKGMELDCINYDGIVTFEEVSDSTIYPIKVSIKYNNECFIHLFTKYGQIARTPYNKCVLFPKGKTSWEGFVPPSQFKDGDIVYVKADSDWIFIYRKSEDTEYLYKYAALRAYLNPTDIGYIATCDSAPICRKEDVSEIRLATDKEKEKLFKAIKDGGYKWNKETKTLKKLVEPKFKVGDNIRIKGSSAIYVVTEIREDCYMLDDKDISLLFKTQDQWELVPNKFDINTLRPFESRVLVRAVDNQFWRPAIWGVKHCGWDYYCVLGGDMWEQCIPYEGNEHLLGNTDDCDEYYKTWEW